MPIHVQRNLRVRHLPHDQLLPEDPCNWTAAELEAWQAVRAGRVAHRASQRDLGWDNLLRYREEQLESRVIFVGRVAPPAEVLLEVPLAWLATRRYGTDSTAPLLVERLRELLATTREANMQGKAKALAKRWIARHPRRAGEGGLTDGRRYPGGLELRCYQDRLHVRLASFAHIDLPVTVEALRVLPRVVTTWRQLMRRVVATHLRLAVSTRATLQAGDRVQWALPLPRGPECAGYVRAWSATTTNIQLVQLLDTDPEISRERLVVADLAMQCLQRYTAHEIDELLRCLLQGDIARWWESPLRPTAPTRAEQIAALDDDARRWIRPLRNGNPSPWDTATEFAIDQDSMTGRRHWVTVPDLAFAIDLERSNRPTVTMRLSLSFGAR